METAINIGRKDVIWNYLATFLQIGSGVILFPFILRTFSQETVAIWTIFTTITGMTALLDFGFNPSFARNVTYVMSGVKELKTTGFEIVEDKNAAVDYGLFKGLINAMKWFYSRIAIVLFILLATAGTYYIFTVLKTYSGDHREVYIAWIVLILINTYSLYTMYYDSLMQGMGKVKKAKQIQIIAQTTYLVAAMVLILFKFNLIAIVSAQALSIIIRRYLFYKAVFTPEFKKKLNQAVEIAKRDLIKPILPNAVKLGLTSLGGFLVTRAANLIGPLYLSLDVIASYGVTIQLIGLINGIANVYTGSYAPKIVQFNIQNDIQGLRHLYIKSCLSILGTFAVCGGGMMLLGEFALELIKSKTQLLPVSFIAVALVIYYLEANHGMAGGTFLLSKNIVPFFKAALFSGALTLILLFVFLKYTNLGVWGLILAQGIAQALYQNWKWPLEVMKDLKFIKK